MTSKTASFEETLNKSLTQGERNLFRQIMVEESEQPPLQRHLKRYDTYVWEEKQHKEKLRTVLEQLIECKNEDEIELIEEKIEGLEEEIEFLQGKQKDITEEILRDVQYGH